MRPALILATIAIALGGFIMVAGGMRTSNLTDTGPTFAGTNLLPANFAHADHVEQGCIECHHNFADTTGQGTCFDCHRTDPDVADLIEQQFHDLCRGCHLDLQGRGDPHGPARRCIDCHVSEDRP